MDFSSGRWTKPITVPVHHAELLELKGAFAGTTAGKDGIIIKGGDQRDKKNRACPMGYDVLFRALGNRLDRRAAVSITICETDDQMYVSYWVDKATFVIREGRRRAVSNVQLETYTATRSREFMAEISRQQAQEMTRYEHGLMINPHDYISMQDAAFLFEADGNYREAESLLNRVVHAVPEHPEAHYHIARLALMRGDRRAASSSIKKALRLQPNEAAVHDLSGRILAQSNKGREAIAAFQRAVELEPDNGLLHYHLSLAFEAAGLSDEAVVEMALSTNQVSAPSWDMVREDIAIEVRPPTPVPTVPLLPAEAALLPTVDLPEPVAAIPTMTTTFEPSDSSWPSYIPSQGRGPVAPGQDASKPAPFGATPVVSPVSADQLGQPTLTLEQRLQLARHAAQPETQTTTEPMSQTDLAPALSDTAAYETDEAERSPGQPGPVDSTASSQPRPAARAGDASAQSVELATEILTIQNALMAEPNRADLHRKLGFLLARQGKTAEAAAEFRKALQASRTSL
jgi:tetratricopeptide (TPR) repeat protein